MRAVSVTLNDAGISDPIPLDTLSPSDQTGIAVVFSGTDAATVSVEVSLDDPFIAYPTDYNTDAHWFEVDIPIDLADITASTMGRLPNPVRAVRLNAATVGTDASITMTVVHQSLL